MITPPEGSLPSRINLHVAMAIPSTRPTKLHTYMYTLQHASAQGTCWPKNMRAHSPSDDRQRYMYALANTMCTLPDYIPCNLHCRYTTQLQC